VAWEAYRGWPAPQITEVLLPALPLAKRARQPQVLGRTLWGLWVNPLTQGRIVESLRWANELLSLVETTADESFTLVANMTAMVTHFWLGNLRTAKMHGDTILAMYDPARHGHIALAMNHDPRTLTALYASHWLWMLGYPDEAARVAEERDVHARAIGHPFDRGFALTTGSYVFEYRGEPERQHALADEAVRLGREHSMPFLSEILAPLTIGVSMVRSGLIEKGLGLMNTGFDLWDGSGARIWSPYAKSIMAEGYALSGDLDKAIGLVDSMLEQVERPGWDERSHLAEILRLKGWMLSLKGDLKGAEKNYLASLDWARKQQAKSWELRTSTSLARLWQGQGKRKKAHQLLAPIYGWFTEGFDTKDLKEAKELLAKLR
jgi:pentatricopeptide repeat protein